MLRNVPQSHFASPSVSGMSPRSRPGTPLTRLGQSGPRVQEAISKQLRAQTRETDESMPLNYKIGGLAHLKDLNQEGLEFNQNQDH